MAGYTDDVFRTLCRRHGAGFTFTEMASADGMVRGLKRTKEILYSPPDESQVGAHLYGSQPAVLARAAELVSGSGVFDVLDLNAGCPMPKVMRKGGGASLLEDPDRLRGAVAALADRSLVPVTVKLRLGIGRNGPSLLELADAAVCGGAAGLSIHGRLAEARHAGDVDWCAIRQVKASSSVPIIGNGGIRTVQEALEHLALGLDGIMVGRSAIGNPWFFQEASARWAGLDYTPPTAEHRYAVASEHLTKLTARMYEWSGDRRRRDCEPSVCRRFRRHLVAYVAPFASSREVRRMLGLETLSAVDQALRAVFTV